MSKITWKSAVPAIAILLAAFVFLLILPELTTERVVRVPSVPAPSSLSALAMDRKFSIVKFSNGKAQKTGETSIAELLKASGRESVVVNLWATWCAPCIEELPSLEYLGRRFERSKDPKIPLLVTLFVDNSVEAVSSLGTTLDFKPSFPMLWDPDGEYSASIGTTRFPETYWFSGKGELLYKWLGPQDWLSDQVLRRLASRTSS